jgi:hypothetical protein
MNDPGEVNGELSNSPPGIEGEKLLQPIVIKKTKQDAAAGRAGAMAREVYQTFSLGFSLCRRSGLQEQFANPTGNAKISDVLDASST